jgi:hypothetical protein
MAKLVSRGFGKKEQESEGDKLTTTISPQRPCPQFELLTPLD